MDFKQLTFFWEAICPQWIIVGLISSIGVLGADLDTALSDFYGTVAVIGMPDLPVRRELIQLLNPFNFYPLLFRFYLRHLDLLLPSRLTVFRYWRGYRRCATCRHKDNQTTKYATADQTTRNQRN